MDNANQSQFERRVIHLVEELDKERQKHKKFHHKKELIISLGLNPGDWFKYKTGSRHLPTHKQESIRQYLIEEYGVSPVWLETGKGSVFSKEIRKDLADPSTPYGIFGDKKIEILEKNNEEKDKRIVELQAEVIKLQKDLLECLRDK